MNVKELCENHAEITGRSRDTIYRQTAIDALMEILDRPNHAEFLYTDEICKALEKLPSAQPEPSQVARDIATIIENEQDMRVLLSQPERKRGEWIETSDGTMCGNCHKFPYDDGDYHIANWYSDFCPNCGSYNGGEKNDKG